MGGRDVNQPCLPQEDDFCVLMSASGNTSNGDIHIISFTLYHYVVYHSCVEEEMENL